MEARKGRRRFVVLLVFLGIALAVVVAFRAVLMPFLVAIFCAYLIDPLVNRISKLRLIRRRRIGRAWAVVVLYLLFLVGIYAIGTVTIPALVHQIREVRNRLPVAQAWVEERATKLVHEWRRLTGGETSEPKTDPAGENSASGHAEKSRVRFHLKGGGSVEGKVLARGHGKIVLDLGNGFQELQESDVSQEEVLRRVKVKTVDGETYTGEVIANRYGTLVLDEGSRIQEIPAADIAEETTLTEEESAVDLKRIIAQQFEQLVRNLDEVLGLAIRVAKWLVTAIYQIFLVLMVTAFLVIDRAKIVGFLHSIPPERHRGLFVRLTDYIDRGLAGVIRGQLMICSVNGLLTWLGLQLLGVHYALMLGFVAGVLTLIPIFGTIVSSVPIVLVAWTTGTWEQGLLALAWVLIIHFSEANILNPKIMGHASKIHPVVIIFALLAGAHAYGVVGALLAVPAASVVQSTFKFYVIDRQAEREDEPLLTAT